MDLKPSEMGHSISLNVIKAFEDSSGEAEAAQLLHKVEVVFQINCIKQQLG